MFDQKLSMIKSTPSRTSATAEENACSCQSLLLGSQRHVDTLLEERKFLEVNLKQINLNVTPKTDKK